VPTILSHPAVPLALAAGLGRRRIPGALLAAGIAASIVPDFDVVGFSLGIAYGDPFGHRGATHSLAFAAALGVLAALFARRLGTRRAIAFAFVAFSAASHGLLDSLTDGGSGVAFLWPFTDERWFAPWRPIAVSPIGVARFLSERGLHVLGSELAWVWLPAVLLGAAFFGLRRSRERP
jgi:inner membrane protein